MVLAIVALLFAWPDLLSYGNRVGKTDFVTQRLSGLVLENPRYVGTDPDGRPYEVSAVRASKDAEDATLLYLDQPQADLMDLEGDSTWMRVTAGSGTYDTTMKLMQLHGGVTILDWAQRSLELETASVDLNAGTLTSTRPVTGDRPERQDRRPGTADHRSRRTYCIHRPVQGGLRPMTGRVRAIGTVAAMTGLLAAIALAPGPARTQGTEETRQLPIEVTADQGIEWNQVERLYVARGNAVATRGDVRISGDTIAAAYQERGQDDSEIYQVEVTGAVVVSAPGKTLYGDRAVYDLRQAVVVLQGEDLRAELGEETVTARDSLEYWEERLTAVARGEAVARARDRTIRADVLTALFERQGDGSLRAVRMNTHGNTRITTADEVVTGRDGIYDVVKETITLEGGVKITRETMQLNGGRAEVDSGPGSAACCRRLTETGGSVA